MQLPQPLARAGQAASKAAARLPGLLSSHRDHLARVLRLRVRHSPPQSSSIEAVDEGQT